MEGRFEHEQKVMASLDNILAMQPDYIRSFSNSIIKSFNTRQSYVYSIIRFMGFLKNKGFNINNISVFEELNPALIDDYMMFIKSKTVNGKIKPTSSSYQATQLHAVKRFYKFLNDKENIRNNPCLKTEIPKVNEDKSIVYLSPNEVKTIEMNINTGVGNSIALNRQKKWKLRDRALMCVGFRTGLRISAISEIDIDDIDFDNYIIHVIEKENKVRDIVIDDETAQAISEWIGQRKTLMSMYQPTNALFISNRRTRMTQPAINKVVKKYSANIDKEITAHKMRSTFAVNVYESTDDIYVVKDLLGHEKVETTEHYVTVTTQKKRAAIAKLPY